MSCAQVRPLLAARSLGILAPDEATAAERHVARCAACRKETGELDAAAASLVFALAPSAPPPELEDRVVEAVRRVAAPARPRRGRMVVASVVAAMLAVAGLGFGAVMAGRAARFRDQAISSKARTLDAQATFRELLQTAEFSDPRNSVMIASLVPPGGGLASGTALTLRSPSSEDMAIVTVSSLHLDKGRFPLQVVLVGPRRHRMMGSIAKVDSGGAATVAMQSAADLSFFTEVVVRDAAGDVVLRGALSAKPLQSPSPGPSPGP